MPIYEYKCDNCGDVFEKIEKFSALPLTVHEKCGGPVHRLISTSALQFKGSGWYVNDYAKSNGKEKTESKPETKTETKGEAKTETKTETKTESPAPKTTE